MTTKKGSSAFQARIESTSPPPATILVTPIWGKVRRPMQECKCLDI